MAGSSPAMTESSQLRDIFSNRLISRSRLRRDSRLIQNMPFELIDLVLVADRAQAVRFLGLQVAVDVVIADPDARMTR